MTEENNTRNTESGRRKEIEFVADLMHQWDERDTKNPVDFRRLPLKTQDFLRAHAQVYLENGGSVSWYMNMLVDYKRANPPE